MARKQMSKILSLPRTKYEAAFEITSNIIGTRITELRRKYGMSQTDFSTILGQHGIKISRAGVWKWESGNSFPDAYQLITISQIFGIESTSFFTSYKDMPELNDLGLQKLMDYKEDLIASGRYSPYPEVAELEYMDMPISYLYASAGPGSFLDGDNFEIMSVPKSSVPIGADFGVRVHGDSMEPVYQDEQLVWVQKAKTLRSGEVGLFIYDGMGYIKSYYEQLPDEDNLEKFTDSNGTLYNQPVLISYNKAKYAPIAINPDRRFEIIGRILR